jgi:hypothetical protein
MILSDDGGVSELMGYTVLVAVVSIAAAGLLTGCMATLAGTEKQLEFSCAGASLKSLGNIMAGAVESNNTFYTAFEMSVPEGYDLIVKNRNDDFRSIGIYEDDRAVAFLLLGSIRLESPFRTGTFEGGAVSMNDSGTGTCWTFPVFHAIERYDGRKALYISAISVSSDSFVAHSGPITLRIRCRSVDTFEAHGSSGHPMTVKVESSDGPAWKERLEKCGFNVKYEDGTIIATLGEAADVYVTYAEADVTRSDF